MRANTSGSWWRSQSSFGAVKLVSARLPVSAISRASPSVGLDLAALGAGALVVPEDRRAQHAVIGVEHDQAVHLPGEPDALRRAGGRAQPVQHALGRPPPVLRILLGPAGPGRRELVSGLRARDHAPVGVEGESLDAAGADVQPEDAHVRTRALRGQAPRAA